MTEDWDAMADEIESLGRQYHESLPMAVVARSLAALCRAQGAAENPETVHERREREGLRMRVRYVDMDGFLGRERHPRKWMVGLIVRPISMTTLVGEELLSVPDSEVADAFRDEENGDRKPEEGPTQIWVCAVTSPAGPVTIVDFMEHELEVVR